MGCLSGCLMSSASIQKLFCGICLAFKRSFDEFVGEKVVSLSFPIKWALGSITMNKASTGDGISVELFQILKDDAVKVL